MRLKVMIRIRPMSQRERSSGSQEVVTVENKNSVAVTNIKVPEQNSGDSRERVRRFAFDYCFPEDTTQDQVFETIESVIGKSLRSRHHSCVLAYGQTSSGKTHTMMGLPQDPGLTPRLCRKIFKYFEDGALNNAADKLKVTVSYLEIYNERVSDLLPKDASDQDRTKSLKVREHPKKGPYVEGLTEHPVSTSDDILQRLEQGSSRRKVGSTATNPRSSRSHSVFSVSCEGVKLHLVDLAGNERAGSRGYGPSRFREGANINKSLVALGNVISTLAEQSRSSSRSSRNKFVPYRDSILTWLLKDTLQGNSNTVMVATISPSSACYSETVNTLRFGQRAKRIIYQPVIVEDPKEITIRELRAEIAKLRDLLTLSHQIVPNPAWPNQMDVNSGHQHLPFEEIPDPQDDNTKENVSRNSESSTSSLPEALHDDGRETEVSESSTTPIPQQITTDRLLPIIDVQSSVSLDKFGQLKRTYSMDRTYSIETDTSNRSYSSQESLQSPKHTSDTKTQTNSQVDRRHSGSTSGVQIKQTALSLRRQAINKSTHTSPLLKTITQKKILGNFRKRPEKGVITDESGLKKPETKPETTKKKPPYTRQRSQIVAAVTSRLYSKVNKKDMATSTENLSTTPKELKICTNARSRLIELTQKALRAHRRKNEETQTDLFPMLRVKEVSTDCNDLEQETKKDAEVECTLLSQFISGTFQNVLFLTRSCGVQTSEEKPGAFSFTKYLTENKNSPIFTESVNINISHNYINGNTVDSMSDDSLDNSLRNNVSFPTPDLISNHNSLEQHAKEKEHQILYGKAGETDDKYEKVTCFPVEKVCAGNVNVLTVPPFRKRFQKCDVISTRASQTFVSDIFVEKCKHFPDFRPQKFHANVSQCPDTKYRDKRYVMVNKHNVFNHIPCKHDYSSNESSLTDDNCLSDVPDSIDYHRTNTKKVQFARNHTQHKKDCMIKAMKEFLEEAKNLMSNISQASSNTVPACQHPHLDDFDIQVTVNELSGIEKSKKRRKRSSACRETSATQTELPSMESCFSQTSHLIPEFTIPVNKYETLLEDSCRRLEDKISKIPRSRNISSVSEEDCDEDVYFDRPKYNPWDLSNVDVEDSSLESNPVTFSDYGSLPRKTHKRQRTPTCSPSAFLKQLSSMRRQIIESSREDLLQSCSK
ncbi:chromosome-associated kinesin KIF4-like [Sitophilus oryzae]|uniref:Chromosome-associated kinesin KIF4-like n=1 Tax=Sitophilus oryzae TaxID=7048 RepID=A0A6J2X423_SITOR|nr:chromosome-associated kinesin KIF4-like [Sitophilus oryzae]